MQKLPFAEFLANLTRQGFIVGVDQHLRLHSLLHRLGPDCPPTRLKSLLCPLFATNAKQQQQFYRAFDAYFAAFDPQRAAKEAEAEAEPPEDTITTSPPLWARKWPYALAGLLLLLLIAFGTYQFLQWKHKPKPPKIETSVPAAPTPSLVERPIKEQIVPLVPLTEPRVTPETQFDALWREYGATLRWIAVLTPLLIFLLLEVYRLNRRKLVLQRERRKTAPYLFQLQIEPPDPAFLRDERFYTAARLMRRRLQSDVSRLDPEGTIRQTIVNGGFPTVQYNPLTRPPEYLLLIERPLGRDHYSQLCETLSGALQQEGIFVTRYFFDRNPRICFQSPQGKREYLYELKDRFPDHRLLILGAGDDLLDPLSGNLDAWTSVFHTWRERALLTTVAPQDWGRREITLASEFVVLPATLDGLAALMDYFEQPTSKFPSREGPGVGFPSREGSGVGSGATSRAKRILPTPTPPRRGFRRLRRHILTPAPSQVENLRAYLGEDVFQWLCACAVYPELHWNLTLSLATLPCMPADLLTEANLLRLIRLPWFREGALPQELRPALLAELGAEQLRDIRHALIAMLERQDPPPPESAAYDVYQLHLAVQRFGLLAWRQRRKWKQRLREQTGAAARRVLQDYTFVRFLESTRVSPLNFVLPRRLRTLFFRQGVPWFGLKTSAQALIVGILMAAVFLGFPTPQPPAAVSDFVMRTFQVADLPSDHPEAVVEEGTKFIPATATSGHLCYGAEITLPASDALDAHFRLAIDNNTADDRLVAVLEVYDVTQQTVLQRKNITRRMFQAVGDFSDFKLSFALDTTTQLEFRIFYEGAAALRADTITLANPAKTMEFVWVEGGCFLMGQSEAEKQYLIEEVGEDDYKQYYSDELPQHEVCVQEGFWMGKYEVTNRQYRSWKPDHDSGEYQGQTLNAEDQPVVLVSWNEVREFTDWLNAQNQEGAEFRLPSEAEWEYAARAGTTTSRFWGDNPDEACQYANVADQTAKQQWSDWTIFDCDDGYAAAAPVGSFRPNQFGLYDMLGNVWEWCADWYGADYYAKSPKENPQGPSNGDFRLLRGGSWVSDPWYVRGAVRSWGTPDLWFHVDGFRVVVGFASGALQ